MYWEIVELEDGAIALVREDEDEPVLTIGFSDEARERLASNHMEVAKAMIGAGMDAVEHFTMLEEESDSADEELLLDDRDSHTVVH
ncbi:MAG: hypothetical protein LAT62_03870 [Natronospirillum sp.]|uniref:hypothetical protein n=1 Tax=Natronospirillum sp. TaxID=2812955 RepID=UPI0025DA31E6|nr:hypothetical protein [Natronospirillum sp.]MCH8551050.1 hypothetical protein [Natronospirillum sp.]